MAPCTLSNLKLLMRSNFSGISLSKVHISILFFIYVKHTFRRYYRAFTIPGLFPHFLPVFPIDAAPVPGAVVQPV